MNLFFWRCAHSRTTWPLSTGAQKVDPRTGSVATLKDGKDRVTCLSCGAQLVVPKLIGPAELVEYRPPFRRGLELL